MKLITAVVACAAVLSGCISTPPRPVYEGADTVGAIDKSALIGKWEVRQLNPVPGTDYPKIVSVYSEDGTVATTMIPTGEMAEAMGSTTYESNGNWGTEGDFLMHSEMKMKTTDNSGSNQFSALLDKVINNRMKDIEAQANVYEVTANRIVLVSPDGIAQEYIRIE